MKKPILTMALLAFMVGTISTSFGQNPDKKLVFAGKNIQDVQKDANPAFQNFRKESEQRIKNVDNGIGDLKIKFYKSKIKDKEAYQDNLNAIEQKNDDLKKKLTDFNSKDQKDRSSFKIEFNRELDELGKALKDFTNKYNK